MKFKITTKIDIDFKNFFDEIPKDIDENYTIDAIGRVFQNMYINELMQHAQFMSDYSKTDYTKGRHHYRIAEEIAKQITENKKIEKI